MSHKRLYIFWVFFLIIPLVGTAQSAQLADSLFQKGKDYDDKGFNKQAEFYYGEAYHLYRQFKDTVGWLNAGKEYASAMVRSSKNKQAMELYNLLLKVDHPANDVYNRGDIYNSMGWSSRRTGKLDQAMKYYQKSLPLAEKSGDSLLLGVVYNNIGQIYYSKGNLNRSLKFRQQALPYFEALGYQRNIAITLNSIGLIYKSLSLYDKALEYFKRSLEIREKLGNISLLSTIYDGIAGVQRELGNYDQALVSYHKSLEYSKQSGEPRSIARTYNNIGLLYKELGEYDKALDYYRQSLDVKEDISASIATTSGNMGNILWAQGKVAEAQSLYRKALELRKQVGNPYDIASSLGSMVRIELEARNLGRARQYADSMQAIGDSTNSYDILKNVFAWRGRIQDAQGNRRAALVQFKKAYAYSQYLPADDQLEPLKNLSFQYDKMNSDSAVFYGQQAVVIIEKSRQNAGALSELKSGYFQRHSDFYTQLASWVLKYEQNTSRAFRLVEQAKARSFTDELEKASQNIEQQLPDDVRIARHQKTQHIDALYTELEQSANTEKRGDLRDKIRAAELDYAAYENNLHDQYPELKSLKSPEPVSLDQAQQMTDEHTAVLEYALADNELIMFLVSQEKVRVKQFSFSGNQLDMSTELTNLVADFKDAILANAPRAELQNRSQKLYDMLLKPFEEDLNNFDNLIVAPDGALAYLPFEAISRGNEYLIQQYCIKYEPSLTSLAMLKDQAGGDEKDLLAVAGSNISEENFGGSFKKSSLAALPSTLIEVDSIASHFSRVSLLEKEQVSEEAFKKLISENRYKYVHLATHGIIDENEPRRSGLALSAEGAITASSREDGLLRSSEIFGLNINSDMVVLSACNTGLGKVVKGEGMLGMQRSFFYAGASSVVVSLWSVYDRSTASLMNEFYKALLKSDTQEEDWTESLLRWMGLDESLPFGRKARAMREAKLKMIHHPLFNHPIYWAPFIVVGR